MRDPNKNCYSTILSRWSSISDVDTFLSRFNHENGYKDEDMSLSLGNYVTIDDGTYNTDWIIAGFDVESSRTAADGTTYDNGYGIALIPKLVVHSTPWNLSKTLDGGYLSSAVHTISIPAVVDNMKTILGSHIVNRNVLLSNSVDSNGRSNSYAWTTAYGTLLNFCQISGNANSYTKYDDGEANYKLPLFNHTDHQCGYQYWLRSIFGYANSNIYSSFVDSNGAAYYALVDNIYYTRPMIYVR